MKRLMYLCLAMALMFVLSTPTIAASGQTTQVSASSLTYEQRINNLKLTPQPLTEIQKGHYEKDYTNDIENISKQDISNYEKLKSTFLYVSDFVSKKGDYNCNTYRGYLVNALYIVGFDVYMVDGLVRTKDPNYQTTYYPNLYHNPKGWMMHEWVGIVIDGKSNAVLTDYYDPDPRALSRGVLEKPSYSDLDFVWGYSINPEGKPYEIDGEVLYLDANLYAKYGMSFEQTFLINPSTSDLYRYAYLNKPWVF